MGLQVVLVDEFPMEFDCAFVCPFRIQVVLVEELEMRFWEMADEWKPMFSTQSPSRTQWSTRRNAKYILKNNFRHIHMI